MTISVETFDVSPLKANTNDKINVSATIDCNNWWLWDNCNEVLVIIKVNGATVSSEKVSIGAWSGSIPYTKQITMPNTNAIIDMTVQEDNRVTRQIAVINMSSGYILPPLLTDEQIYNYLWWGSIGVVGLVGGYVLLNDIFRDDSRVLGGYDRARRGYSVAKERYGVLKDRLKQEI